MKFVQKYQTYFIVGLSIVGICVGLATYIPLWQSIPMGLGAWGVIQAGFTSFINWFSESKGTHEKQLEEMAQEYEDVLKKQEEQVQEQDVVIEEYEKIFDSLLVHLPCVCGGNTFEGLFSPNHHNEVICKNCKNKYSVSVNYDTVLISEPLDVNQSLETLVEKSFD